MVSLLNVIDLSYLSYEDTCFRAHLKTCMENRKFDMFPHVEERQEEHEMEGGRIIQYKLMSKTVHHILVSGEYTTMDSSFIVLWPM